MQNNVIQGADFAANDGTGRIVAYTGYTNAVNYDGTPASLLQGNVTAALLVDYDAQLFENVTAPETKTVAVHALVNF